ncbi:MAG: hypothetical protein BWY76_01853 [bacterium ADurb.Bin429]|nr:MAG: hypothetical protein BWY76_01853 [bacterium ADurb.Bin429]
MQVVVAVPEGRVFRVDDLFKISHQRLRAARGEVVILAYPAELPAPAWVAVPTHAIPAEHIDTADHFLGGNARHPGGGIRIDGEKIAPAQRFIEDAAGHLWSEGFRQKLLIPETIQAFHVDAFPHAYRVAVLLAMVKGIVIGRLPPQVAGHDEFAVGDTGDTLLMRLRNQRLQARFLQVVTGLPGKPPVGLRTHFDHVIFRPGEHFIAILVIGLHVDKEFALSLERAQGIAGAQAVAEDGHPVEVADDGEKLRGLRAVTPVSRGVNRHQGIPQFTRGQRQLKVEGLPFACQRHRQFLHLYSGVEVVLQVEGERALAAIAADIAHRGSAAQRLAGQIPDLIRRHRGYIAAPGQRGQFDLVEGEILVMAWVQTEGDLADAVFVRPSLLGRLHLQPLMGEGVGVGVGGQG